MRTLIFYIFFVVLSASLLTFFAFSNLYLYSVLSFIVLLFSTYKLISLYSSTQEKVSFMFNAIDCDDYSFKFTDNGANVSNYMLNHSLNRIKEIMTNAKIRAIEREKYYELIMNSVKTGILTINENGNIFQVNNELLKTIGLSVFTHINQLNNVQPNLVVLLKDIKPGEKRQYTLYNERGEIKISLSASSMLFDGRNHKIIAVNDINTAIDQNEVDSWVKLTRVLTHEIMNSLAPITSLSSTLIDINDNQNINIGLETIKTTSLSLISFVDSYRKFTRLQEPVKSPFLLEPFVNNIISLLVTQNNIKKYIDIEPNDVMIYADKDMINQVLTNLVKNAIYALENSAKEDNEKELLISASILPDENILLSITNNGGKIPNDISKDIFMPFFTTKEEGSGIGLSVSRQIMHLHGGQLKLTSNTDDRVTFSLIFN